MIKFPKEKMFYSSKALFEKLILLINVFGNLEIELEY